MKNTFIKGIFSCFFILSSTSASAQTGNPCDYYHLNLNFEHQTYETVYNIGNQATPGHEKIWNTVRDYLKENLTVKATDIRPLGSTSKPDQYACMATVEFYLRQTNGTAALKYTAVDYLYKSTWEASRTTGPTYITLDLYEMQKAAFSILEYIKIHTELLKSTSRLK